MLNLIWTINSNNKWSQFNLETMYICIVHLTNLTKNFNNSFNKNIMLVIQCLEGIVFFCNFRYIKQTKV